MKLSEAVKKDYNLGRALTIAVCGEQFANSISKPNFYGYVRRRDREVEDLTFKEVDDLVYLANQMVKSPECSRTWKNRFYKYKHRYVKEHMRLGNVERVLESEKLYHFYIRDSHDYHQLKAAFNKTKVVSSGVEVYIPQDYNVAFDKDVYDQAIIQMIQFSIKNKDNAE